jgi:hypothetical protein
MSEIIKNPQTLSDVQDQVFANKMYWPTEDDGQEVTYCNLATNAVLEAMGYAGFQGMTADQMYAWVSTSKDWLIKPMADCQELVNEGVILIAILSSTKLGQTHGHVNTLTPGKSGFSGHWNMADPVCMNLGRVGTCFRSVGLSYAFVPIPEIYALVSTL